MNRRLSVCCRITAGVVGTFLVNGIVPAHGGPCTERIAQFEQAVRESGTGPMAPQTVGAQLDRQPTPASMKRAERRARAAFAAVMARAKRFDTRGDRAGCERALARARAMYNM